IHVSSNEQALELVAVADVGPLAAHTVAVHLARLAPGSRPTMARALDTIAGVLTSGACDRWSLPWARVRYRHAQAVRAALVGLMAWRRSTRTSFVSKPIEIQLESLRSRVVRIPPQGGDPL